MLFCIVYYAIVTVLYSIVLYLPVLSSAYGDVLYCIVIMNVNDVVSMLALIGL